MLETVHIALLMMGLPLVVVMLLNLLSFTVTCTYSSTAKAAELCFWGTSAGSSQVFSAWGCALGTATAGRNACPHDAVRSKYSFCYEESESESMYVCISMYVLVCMY